jgi:hypothetical protein
MSTLSRCMVSTTSGRASSMASTFGSRVGSCIAGAPAICGANTVWYFQCGRAKSARPLTMRAALAHGVDEAVEHRERAERDHARDAGRQRDPPPGHVGDGAGALASRCPWDGGQMAGAASRGVRRGGSVHRLLVRWHGSPARRPARAPAVPGHVRSPRSAVPYSIFEQFGGGQQFGRPARGRAAGRPSAAPTRRRAGRRGRAGGWSAGWHSPRRPARAARR